MILGAPRHAQHVRDPVPEIAKRFLGATGLPRHQSAIRERPADTERVHGSEFVYLLKRGQLIGGGLARGAPQRDRPFLLPAEPALEFVKQARLVGRSVTRNAIWG